MRCAAGRREHAALRNSDGSELGHLMQRGAGGCRGDTLTAQTTTPANGGQAMKAWVERARPRFPVKHVYGRRGLR